MGKCGDWNISTHKACWKAALQLQKGAKQKEKKKDQNDNIREEDHMKIDMATLQKFIKLTDDEWAQLQKIGACLFCWNIEHMPRNGLEKEKKTVIDAKPLQLCAQKADTKEVPKVTVGDIHVIIHALSKEKWGELLDKLVDEGIEEADLKSQATVKDFWPPNKQWLTLRAKLAWNHVLGRLTHMQFISPSYLPLCARLNMH